MSGTPYRKHENGPLVDIRHDRPGRIYVVMTFDLPGQHVPGHIHAFDHVMHVRAGAVRMVADGAESILRVGDRALIVAGVRHGLWSLASGTIVECEHEVRTENGVLAPEAFCSDGTPMEWLRRLTVSEVSA